MKSLSIIIPVLNEAALIQHHLRELRRTVSDATEIIVVDGGSTDETLTLAHPLADQVITSSKGRAAQMNAGAAIAQGQCLLFLHIDTQLPVNVLKQLSKASESDWGFFAIRLSGQRWEFRLIEFMINARSRLSAVATGDQCIFIGRQLFAQCGGYKALPLMEDVEISKRLRRIQSPMVITNKAVTSSRRWEEHGIWRTVILMWRLRWAFFRGADPHTFAERYYPKS